MFAMGGRMSAGCSSGNLYCRGKELSMRTYMVECNYLQLVVLHWRQEGNRREGCHEEMTHWGEAHGPVLLFKMRREFAARLLTFHTYTKPALLSSAHKRANNNKRCNLLKHKGVFEEGEQAEWNFNIFLQIKPLHTLNKQMCRSHFF